MMYEDLVKSLRAQADYYCCHMGINSPPAMTFVEAADAIEDLDNRLNLYRQGKISRWIPVSERLPEKYHHVLVYSKTRGRSFDFINADGNWYTTPRATHWMPLPEPPKEKEA